MVWFPVYYLDFGKLAGECRANFRNVRRRGLESPTGDFATLVQFQLRKQLKRETHPDVWEQLEQDIAQLEASDAKH